MLNNIATTVAVEASAYKVISSMYSETFLGMENAAILVTIPWPVGRQKRWTPCSKRCYPLQITI